MVTLLTHRLPTSEHPITYAPCNRPPFVETGWWFVTLPAHAISPGPAASYIPAQDHTFIVAWHRATPTAMDQLGGNVDAWTDIAHQVLVGDWCPRYECLWIDVPVFEHSLTDRIRVRFGYCRTQPPPERYPERELWFVTFQAGPTFIVDHSCATPTFIDRIGDDALKWRIISWQQLGREVVWESLIPGQRSDSPVRADPTIPLDSPHIPPDLAAIHDRIATYEARIATGQDTGHYPALYDLLKGMTD